jgi:hypothetical protein
MPTLETKMFSSSGTSSGINIVNIFFWITAAFHFFVDGLWWNFDRNSLFGTVFWVYIVIALFMGFFILKKDNFTDTLKQTLICILVSLTAIYIPVGKALIVNLISPFSNVPIILINGLILFTGAWPLYLWRQGHLSGLTRGFADLYISGWIIFLILIMFYNSYELALKPNLDTPPIDAGQVIAKVTELSKKLITDAMSGIIVLPGTIQKAANESWYKATGMEYYTGQVEQNAKEKIGVYIEKVKEADPRNYEDQPITLWATIVAKVYDGGPNEENVLKITPSCTSDKGKKNEVPGDVQPPGTFSVYSYEQQDIDCIFNPKEGKSLSYGDHTITINARFNFKTKSYKKVNFVDYELFKSMARENIDIYKQYNLDKNMLAIYTNGPIEVAIEPQDIIPVKDPGADAQSRVSVSFIFKNRWEGELKKINKVRLYVPTGLAKEYCNKNFTAVGLEADSTVFELDNVQTYEDSISDVFQAFRCSFNVDDKSTLLGQSPVSSRYIRVETEYEYELRKAKTINVRRSVQT